MGQEGRPVGTERNVTTGAGLGLVRVAVQQCHPMYRAGLALLLPGDPAIEVVGSVSTAEQLVALCRRAHPAVDVALLDGDLDPAVLVDATRSLRRRHPAIVLMALAVQRGTSRSMRDVGFDTVVERCAGIATIASAVLSAAGRAGAATLPPGTAPPVLSEREREVLSLLGRGLTVRAISECLAISAKTVEHHKSHIFDKLKTCNQAHAVSVALRTGLLPVDPMLGPS